MAHVINDAATSLSNSLSLATLGAKLRLLEEEIKATMNDTGWAVFEMKDSYKLMENAENKIDFDALIHEVKNIKDTDLWKEH